MSKFSFGVAPNVRSEFIPSASLTPRPTRPVPRLTAPATTSGSFGTIPASSNAPVAFSNRYQLISPSGGAMQP